MNISVYAFICWLLTAAFVGGTVMNIHWSREIKKRR